MSRVDTALGTQFAKRAAELLGDGEWHDIETVLIELGKLVPPGRAMRRREVDRRTALEARRKRGIAEGPAQPEPSVEAKVRTGRRAIVRDFLGSTSAYERDRIREPGRPASASAGQRIRRVHAHRWENVDPNKERADRLTLRIEQLNERDTALRVLLDQLAAAVSDVRTRKRASRDELAAPIDELIERMRALLNERNRS